MVSEHRRRYQPPSAEGDPAWPREGRPGFLSSYKKEPRSGGTQDGAEFRGLVRAAKAAFFGAFTLFIVVGIPIGFTEAGLDWKYYGAASVEGLSK